MCEITVEQYLDACDNYSSNLKLIQDYNMDLITKYPFLIPTNTWTGEKKSNFDYTITMLDSMPRGWRLKFGEQMCEDIKEVLLKANYLDKYVVVQIKEKFGALRWYDSGIPEDYYEELQEVITKYEFLSSHTCINCGKEALYESQGWICPFCEECTKKAIEEDDYSPSFIPFDKNNDPLKLYNKKVGDLKNDSND